MKIKNNTILITGGAEGIGFALAKAFVEKNNTVIICDINEYKLKEVAYSIPQAHRYACDVARGEERKRLFREISATYPELNILINNAAIFHKIDYTKDIPLHELEREVLTNFMAPLVLSSMFLPLFIRKPNTAIVNISSTAGVQPQYTNPLYSGTKAGLTIFSESLRNILYYHLKKKSCAIVEVFPPIVDTQMTAGHKAKKVSPDIVAQKILEGLAKDKKQIWIFKKDVQFVFFSSRLLISLLRFPRKIVLKTKNVLSGRGFSW